MNYRTDGRYWESGWYAILGNKIVSVQVLAPIEDVIVTVSPVSKVRIGPPLHRPIELVSRDREELERVLAIEALAR